MRDTPSVNCQTLSPFALEVDFKTIEVKRVLSLSVRLSLSLNFRTGVSNRGKYGEGPL